MVDFDPQKVAGRMQKNIYEILDEFERAPTKEDKRNILWFNQSIALKAVLQNAFHPDIQWVIKEAPVYKASLAPPGLGYNTIASELRKFYLFREGNPAVDPNLPLQRKTVLLIQMLEAMEAREAMVVINMMMKNLKVKGLTYSVVKEIFPDLLP